MKTVHFALIVLALMSIVSAVEAGMKERVPVLDCLSRVSMVDTKGRDFTVMPTAGSTRAFLMYNGYTCRECLLQIDSLLDVVSRGHKAVDIVLLSRAVSRDVLRIRDAIDHAKSLNLDRTIAVDLPDSGTVDPWPPVNLQGGAFGCFGVTKTPAMIVIDSQAEVHFFSYAALASIDSNLVDNIRTALFGAV